MENGSNSILITLARTYINIGKKCVKSFCILPFTFDFNVSVYEQGQPNTQNMENYHTVVKLTLQ